MPELHEYDENKQEITLKSARTGQIKDDRLGEYTNVYHTPKITLTSWYERGGYEAGFFTLQERKRNAETET